MAKRKKNKWLPMALLACVLAGGVLGGFMEMCLLGPAVRRTEAERDRLVEIVAERETLAGRLDRIEAAMSGLNGCPVGAQAGH